MRSTRPRRVAVVTGTRAEYGLLRSTMRAIDRHPRLRLQLVVTGMHLLRKFGRTIDAITSDGWRIDARVPMQTGLDDRLDQAVGLSRGVAGMARYFERAGTDVVVVLGDRLEAAAGALAAITTGRIVAHIHGGDVAVGDVDDSLRHAITKLAHIHLAATAQAARRIIRLGERRECVFNVGAPGLDRLTEVLRVRSATTVSESPRGLKPAARMALVVFHPAGRSPAREGRTMSAILRAVADAALTPMVVYPNSDPGHTGIIAVIEKARRRKRAPLQAMRSLARDDYLRLLAEARVLVGNSSSGIIEAASAGTPAVNIGDRQGGRQHSSPSVVDCGESYAEIRAAISTALSKRPRRGHRTCYGDGQAGQRIAKILAGIRIDEHLRRKQITY